MRRSLVVVCLLGLLIFSVSGTKTRTGLVNHAKMALAEKWGYVFGTFGYKLTESILQEKIRMYPNNVKPFESFIRQNYLNKKRTADCVGLIKSYLWWNGGSPKYNAAQDKNANMMYNLSTKKGPISSIPETPGLCLWKKGHIGVYVGSGWAIESRGTKQGVIRSPVKGSGSAGWTHWMQCPFIKY
ncbi:hypothetical protein P9112_001856 [Eukaryota sp. TZLM1-RC]